MRYHALLSADVVTSPEEKFWYEVVAAKATNARRLLQDHIVPECAEPDWCLLKVSESLRQTNYETMNGDREVFSAINDLCNMVSSKITGVDLTHCESCAADHGVVQS